MELKNTEIQNDYGIKDGTCLLDQILRVDRQMGEIL